MTVTCLTQCVAPGEQRVVNVVLWVVYAWPESPGVFVRSGAREGRMNWGVLCSVLTSWPCTRCRVVEFASAWPAERDHTAPWGSGDWLWRITFISMSARSWNLPAHSARGTHKAPRKSIIYHICYREREMTKPGFEPWFCHCPSKCCNLTTTKVESQDIACSTKFTFGVSDCCCCIFTTNVLNSCA